MALKPVTKKLRNYKEELKEYKTSLEDLVGTYVIQDDDECVTEIITIWTDGVFYKGEQLNKVEFEF